MRTKLILWLAGVTLALAPALAAAQDATIHGHVQDPANAPIAGAQVVLSTDGKTALYTFTADQNGDYKGGGIKPNTYVITLFAPPAQGATADQKAAAAGKAVDRFQDVKLTAGADPRARRFTGSRRPPQCVFRPSCVARPA